MKNVKNIFFVIYILLSGQVSAATISWDSPITNVNVNDVFTIDIIGTDFLDNVDGGGVNFTFNQTALNILSVNINETVWDFGGFGINTGTINNAAGTVDGIMVNTFSNVTGNFTVATIEIQAIAAGSSQLTLSEFGLNPWASGGSLINPGFVDGTVNVSSVPLPASIWLLSTGILGLFGIAKRKSHS